MKYVCASEVQFSHAHTSTENTTNLNKGRGM